MLKSSPVLVILLISFFHGISQTGPDTLRTILDTSRGPMLKWQCSRSTPKDMNKFWVIKEKDLEVVHANFPKLLTLDAIGCCSGGRIEDLEKYALQFVGVIIKRRKYVYINAFPKRYIKEGRFENWKTEPVWVCDGGDDFWGVLFDVKRKIFLKLSFNGSA